MPPAQTTLLCNLETKVKIDLDLQRITTTDASNSRNKPASYIMLTEAAAGRYAKQSTHTHTKSYCGTPSDESRGGGGRDQMSRGEGGRRTSPFIFIKKCSLSLSLLFISADFTARLSAHAPCHRGASSETRRVQIEKHCLISFFTIKL